MGDIADMMLEGVMCQGCGEFMGEGNGYAVFCGSCQKENGCDVHGDKPKKEKIQCSDCGKWVSEIGMPQHKIAKHGW